VFFIFYNYYVHISITWCTYMICYVFIVFKRFYSHVPNKLEEPTLVPYVLTRFGRVTLKQKPLLYMTVVRTRFSCTCSLAVSSFSTSCSRSCAGNIRVFIPSSVVPTRCLTICSLSSYIRITNKNILQPDNKGNFAVVKQDIVNWEKLFAVLMC